jgi:hypothetical protein
MTAWRTTSRKLFLNETEVRRHSPSVAIRLQPAVKETKLVPNDKMVASAVPRIIRGKSESATRVLCPLPDLIR